MENINKDKMNSTWDFLWYALYAFAGLGLEIILWNFIEPNIWGRSVSYKPSQNVIHWILTIICWVSIILLLIKNSSKKLKFDVINANRVSLKGILLSMILIIICIMMNSFEDGNLKIIGEFRRNELIEFIFQNIYYIFEVGLVFLIIDFGQEFFEKLFNRNTNVPYGGIVLALTWGLIHILTQSDIITGLVVMLFSVIYGIIYLLLNKNSKLTYLAILLAFII